MKDIEMTRVQDEIKATMTRSGMTEEEWAGHKWAFVGKIFFKGDEQVCSSGAAAVEAEVLRNEPRLQDSIRSRLGMSGKDWHNLIWVFSGVVHFIGDEQVGHDGGVAIDSEGGSDRDRVRRMAQAIRFPCVCAQAVGDPLSGVGSD